LQIFYGISANPHAFWSIANARRVIDYAPEDSSEFPFARLIAEHLRAAGAPDGAPRVRGEMPICRDFAIDSLRSAAVDVLSTGR
jgi:hypothetical protein